MRHCNVKFPGWVDDEVDATLAFIKSKEGESGEIAEMVTRMFESSAMFANECFINKPATDEYEAIAKYCYMYEDKDLSSVGDLVIYLMAVVWNRALAIIYPAGATPDGVIVKDSAIEHLPFLLILDVMKDDKVKAAKVRECVVSYFEHFGMNNPIMTKQEAEYEEYLDIKSVKDLNPNLLKEHFEMTQELEVMDFKADYDDPAKAELHDKILKGFRELCTSTDTSK